MNCLHAHERSDAGMSYNWATTSPRVEVSASSASLGAASDAMAAGMIIKIYSPLEWQRLGGPIRCGSLGGGTWGSVHLTPCQHPHTPE